MRTEFFIPMKRIPSVTSQEKGIAVRHGKPIVYTKQSVSAVKVLFRDSIGKYVPETPYIGAVSLVVKWCYPTSEHHTSGEWKTTKPDTDNLIKLLKDVMTDLHFWKDDSQVANEINQKFYNEIPGIYVKVEELEDK